MFKKSSRCGTGQCVEVAVCCTVRVRETGRSDIVAFDPAAWRAFLAFVRAGGVDG